MSNLAYLGQIIDSLYIEIAELFELNDHILTNPMVPERVDKSIVLQESIEDIRKIAARLELLHSRMKGERDGNARENEGS